MDADLDRMAYVPPGLVRCSFCGEFRGTTYEKYLSKNPHPEAPYDDPDAPVSANCRCDGPLCRGCGVNRILRPYSGHYHHDINRILHVPSFMGLVFCARCVEPMRPPTQRDLHV